jgi:transposase-like protein
MASVESQDRSAIEKKELVCPACGHGLVPVWKLPKEKTKYLQPVEIRQQFYCEPCDRRFALEEIDFSADGTAS